MKSGILKQIEHLKEVITIEMDSELYEDFKKLAENAGMSISSLFIYLYEEEKEEFERALCSEDKRAA